MMRTHVGYLQAEGNMKISEITFTFVFMIHSAT